MRKPARRLLISPLNYFLRVILKAILTTLIFYAAAATMMLWMGHDVPSLSELENYFERLAELSGILS